MKNLVFGFCLMPLLAVQAVEISAVSAKQRWPWNNLVDIDFTVDAPAGDIYRAVINAKSESGEIVSIGKFNEDQTAYLAVGDEIVIPKYARYPIITNEKESRQKWLCPLCGEVNRDGTPCTGCGFEYD